MIYKSFSSIWWCLSLKFGHMQLGSRYQYGELSINIDAIGITWNWTEYSTTHCTLKSILKILKFHFIQKASESSSCWPRSQKWSSLYRKHLQGHYQFVLGPHMHDKWRGWKGNYMMVVFWWKWKQWQQFNNKEVIKSVNRLTSSLLWTKLKANLWDIVTSELSPAPNALFDNWVLMKTCVSFRAKKSE